MQIIFYQKKNEIAKCNKSLMNFLDLPNEIIATIILAADDPREMYLAANLLCRRTRHIMSSIILRIISSLDETIFAKFKYAKKLMFYEFAAIIRENYDYKYYKTILCWHIATFGKDILPKSFIMRYFDDPSMSTPLYLNGIISFEHYKKPGADVSDIMHLECKIYSREEYRLPDNLWPQIIEPNISHEIWNFIMISVFLCVNINNAKEIIEIIKSKITTKLLCSQNKAIEMIITIVLTNIIMSNHIETQYCYHDMNKEVIKKYFEIFDIHKNNIDENILRHENIVRLPIDEHIKRKSFNMMCELCE